MTYREQPAAFFNPYAMPIDTEVAIALLADLQIRRAIERGEFDDLPAAATRSISPTATTRIGGSRGSCGERASSYCRHRSSFARTTRRSTRESTGVRARTRFAARSRSSTDESSAPDTTCPVARHW